MFLSSFVYGGIDTAVRRKKSCWSSGNKFPARWWEEGSIIDRGKYWYKCYNGELKPMGCFSVENKRLKIGESYVQNGYEMTCMLGSEGYPNFNFTHCVPDGETKYKVGSSWIDANNKYWYICRQDGPYLRMDIGGCVAHDKKTKLKIDENFDWNNYTYTCRQKAGGIVQMCATGCIVNNDHYKFGQQWNDDKFVYYCKQKGGRAVISVIGCMHDGDKLFDGDSFIDGNEHYQCQIRETSHGVKSNGCVAVDENGNKEKKTFGCRWTKVLKNGNKVQQVCLRVNGKGVIKTDACIFVKNGKDLVYLEPNYYTVWTAPSSKEPMLYACKVSDNGTFSLDIYSIHDSKDKIVGMKYDKPRG
uniref:Ricin B-type lectin domain-containing protein n=1 Tax=Parastrongyloides trichosuri TaxID=131310 RepID=A0A0N4ZCQ4_PARTI